MGRISKTALMPQAARDLIDAAIRSHNYCQLDVMLKVLGAAGISISRSALHRQVKKLTQADAVNCRDENITVVILVSRATGKTETLMTSESTAQILARIRTSNAIA